MRGAPAIAIVGCLSLAADISHSEYKNKDEMLEAVCSKLDYLVTARPTAVNMKNAAMELKEYVSRLHADSLVLTQDMITRYANGKGIKSACISMYKSISLLYRNFLVMNNRNIMYCTMDVIRICEWCEKLLEEDIATNKKLGNLGAASVLAGADGVEKVCVLTHCNTGSLATAGYGTALGVARSLHVAGKLGECTVL